MSTTKVGSEILVPTATFRAQDNATVIQLTDGSFAVSWRDDSGNDASGKVDIKVRIIDPWGQPVGDEILANDIRADGATIPAIAPLDGGGFVVTWTDTDADTNMMRVRAQAFDDTGNRSGDQLIVNAASTTSEFPSVTGLSDNAFVISWIDNGTLQILAQRVSGTGELEGSVFPVDLQPVTYQQPTSATLADGRFVVAWRDEGGAALAQMFSEGGHRIGGVIQVSSSEQALYPSIIALSDGGFAVAWLDQTGAPSVRLQLYDSTGSSVLANEIIVNNTPASAFAVDVAAVGDDHVVVTWSSTTTAGDVHAQIFDLNGNEVGEELLVNTTTSGRQFDVSASALSGTRFMVAWTDMSAQGGDTSGNAVRAQIFKIPTAATAMDDVGFKGFEDTRLDISVADLLANDIDIDGDELHITSIKYAGANATIVLKNNGTPADPSDDFITIDPVNNFDGNISFSYTIEDEDGNKSTASVRVNLAPVNDAPTIDPEGAQYFDEDTLVIFNDRNGNGIHIDDPDSGTSEIQVTLTAADGGLLSLTNKSGLTFLPNGTDNDGENDPILTFKGTLDDVEAALIDLSLKTPTGFVGPTTLRIDVDDLGNTGSGGAKTTTYTIDIFMDPVNDGPPVSVDDTYTVPEDGILGVGLPGILVNDSDIDGDPLTVALVDDVTNGTLILKRNGSFDYTPDADFHGIDSFTYRANDGTERGNIATVTITVTPENDGVPVSVADSYSVDEDSKLTITTPGVLANDGDVDGDALTAILVDDVSSGTLILNSDGSFDYTPYTDFNGTDSFTYKAHDGTADGNTVTVTLTIDAISDGPPVAEDDSYTVNEDDTLAIVGPGVLVNDTDTDGDPLTAVLIDDVANGTLILNEDGSFDYTPDADFHGTDSFTYRANDGTDDGNIATVTLTVMPENVGVPVSVADGYSVDEDSKLTITTPGVLANDSDVDGDTLTAVLVDDVSSGTLILNEDGSFDYTPDADFHGTDSFSYKANDGTAEGNIATVTITVTPENDSAPNSVADSYSVNEDDTLSIAGPGVLINDSDPDDDALTAVLVDDVANGTLTLDKNGSFEYAPDANFNGTDSFTYRANDGTAHGNTVTVTLTVDPVNDAAIGSPTAVLPNGTENQAYILPAADLLEGFSDPDGDRLSVINLAVRGGIAIDNGDGTFTITLPAGTTGRIELAYQVSDGEATIDAEQSFVVPPIDDEYNEPPSGADKTVTTLEDTAYIFAAADFGFSDTDGDRFAGVRIATLPTNGRLLLDGKAVATAQMVDAAMLDAGRLSFMPTENAHGDDYASLTFQVQDDGGGTDLDPTPNMLTIDVTSVNDAAVGPPTAILPNGTKDQAYILPAADLLEGFSDPDGDPLSVTNLTVRGGTAVDNGDGTFTITLPAGTTGRIELAYQVSDGRQAIDAEQTFTVLTGTSSGENQPAAFTGNVSGVVVEAGTSTPGIPTATGTLAVSDPDGPDTLQPIIVGTRSIWGYGTVELTRDGAWTYTLDNANPAVDALAAGQTLTDRFVALAADGTQQVVIITITGADDGRTVIGTPDPDTLAGTPDDDVIRGLAGRDMLTSGGGDDGIDGGRGLDTALFSGNLAGYRLTRIDERTVEIVDIHPADGDDGTDILSSIELLRFGDADPVTIGSLAGQPDWTLERDDVGVTAATYQLFMGGVPTAGGFDYLVLSDVNTTDLNDPYYFIFNLENRYLNFASNLGTDAPSGAAWFDAEYGALSYEQALEKAFASIVTADALRAIGADPAVALDFFLDGRAFFEAVAAERVMRPGVDLAEATKIVMLGSMLYEAVKANVGSYGEAVNDFADIIYASGTHEDLGGSLFAMA